MDLFDTLVDILLTATAKSLLAYDTEGRLTGPRPSRHALRTRGRTSRERPAVRLPRQLPQRPPQPVPPPPLPPEEPRLTPVDPHLITRLPSSRVLRVKPRTHCAVEGCGLPAGPKGLCALHSIARNDLAPSTEPPEPVQDNLEPTGRCKVSDCPAPATSTQGFCAEHDELCRLGTIDDQGQRRVLLRTREQREATRQRSKQKKQRTTKVFGVEVQIDEEH